jgi:hypothetical protein
MWHKVYEQQSCHDVFDAGAKVTDELFAASYSIFRMDRNGKPYAYYRRVSPFRITTSVHALMLTSWLPTDNENTVDFRIYSTEEDARNDVNSWKYCDYTSGCGFPGKCGPSAWNGVWTWAGNTNCVASGEKPPELCPRRQIPGTAGCPVAGTATAAIPSSVAFYVLGKAKIQIKDPSLSRFKGLSSRLAPDAGLLLDFGTLETPSYQPWYGLGVQDSPASYAWMDAKQPWLPGLSLDANPDCSDPESENHAFDGAGVFTLESAHGVSTVRGSGQRHECADGGWSMCAAYGETCAFEGVALVRLVRDGPQSESGSLAESEWYLKEASGGLECTAATFLNANGGEGFHDGSRCVLAPLATDWSFCADASHPSTTTCSHGAGVFLTRTFDGATPIYRVSTTGSIECDSTCDVARVGFPLRIPGPEPSYVQRVALYVLPRANVAPTCISCDACFDAEGEPVRRNLARSAAATQSSTDGVSAAAFAVDGDATNTGWTGGRLLMSTCAYTDGTVEAPAWWRVDLGSALQIHSVRIWAAPDAAPDGAVVAMVTNSAANPATDFTLCSSVPTREKHIRGSGGSLEPPGPLPMHLHTVYVGCSERLPTLSNPPWLRGPLSPRSRRRSSRPPRRWFSATARPAGTSPSSPSKVCRRLRTALPRFYGGPYRVGQVLKGSGDSYRNLTEMRFSVVFGLRQATSGRAAAYRSARSRSTAPPRPARSSASRSAAGSTTSTRCTRPSSPRTGSARTWGARPL